MAKKTKDSNLSLEERLEQALIPNWDEPYKLPKNWCWTNLGTLCKIINGFAFKSNKFSDTNGTPVIRITNIKDGYIDIENSVFTIEEDIDEKFVVCQGDLLIAMSGATTGKNGIYRDNKRAFLNQRVGNIKIINTNALAPEFRNYYIAYMQDEVLKSAYGGAQPNISSEKICQFPIALPPLAEQKRISNLLEKLFAKLEEAEEKAQEIVDGFETRKAAILHKAFSGELTEKWREENGVSIDNWTNVTISDVCKVNPSKINTKDLADDLEVSFFPMLALSEVYGEITEPQTRKLKEVKTGFTNFSEGDVVFAKITPCMENGKSAVIGKLVNNIGYGTTEFYVLRCGEKAFNRYIYHLLRSKAFRDDAKQVMTGAVGQQRVPKSFLEQYILFLPSIPEQKEIASILDRMYDSELKAIETAKAVIEQIDTMKKAILARAFRGELGTNNPSEESAIELIKQIIEEKIKTEESKPKRTPTKRKEVGFVAKTILEVLKSSEKLTPEKLKVETALEIDDFYDQLKVLIDNGQIREIRIDGESYLEAVK